MRIKHRQLVGRQFTDTITKWIVSDSRSVNIGEDKDFTIVTNTGSVNYSTCIDCNVNL